MKLVIQRVKHASVTVEGNVTESVCENTAEFAHF